MVLVICLLGSARPDGPSRVVRDPPDRPARGHRLRRAPRRATDPIRAGTSRTGSSPAPGRSPMPRTRISRTIDKRVLARGRVVVVAEQQQAGDRRADPAGARPLDLGLQVPGRVVDPVVVAGEPPVGRHDDDAGRVRVELGLRVVRVPEADRPGHRVDRRPDLPVRKCQPESVPGRSYRSRYDAFFCDASSGVSSGSMLIATTSKSLPASIDSGRRLRVRAFRVWLQSSGHW